MAFRRIPFHFSSTDPVERQAELEKRFGLPSRNNMYVDVANPLTKTPLTMGASKRDLNQSSSSPRLQHRVPIFLEGCDQPVKCSVDSIGKNPDVKKKLNVRVVPIEIEGDTQSCNRHRTCSGPAGWANKEVVSPRDNSSPLKRSMQDLSQPSKVKAATGPQVRNIPVHVEKSPSKPAKVSKSSNLNVHSKENGCTASKPLNKVKSEKTEPESIQKAESCIQVALKKIEKVLEDLKPYESGVQEFVGTVKDKQYRYLDEMLTRCMLRLDDVETMGNDKVRSARKSAIRKVQACVDLLETKINAEYVCESTNGSDIQDTNSLSKDSDMEESGDSHVTPECNDENGAEITEVEMTESRDSQHEETADTKISNGVTKLQMTELQKIVLDSQTEVEMEENKLFEKEVTNSAATKETEAHVADVSSENVNSEIPEVKMVKSKTVESEGLSVSDIQDTNSLSKDNDMEESGGSHVTPECNDENAAEITEVEMTESRDSQYEETADTKISNGVTKLQMTELQKIVLDSQTEVEMEENKLFEKEVTNSVATKETEADVSSENVNSEIPEVKMVKSKTAESEGLSVSESSPVYLSQNIVHSNMLEDQISATTLSDNSKSEESCCQSLDNSSITCDVNVPEVTNIMGPPNLSDQISTDL